MKLAIVGANGFIGRNLLLGADPENEIFALDLGEGLGEFLSRGGLSRVRWISCDLGDRAALSRLGSAWGKEFDAVIYLAGNGDPARSTAEPAFDLRSSALGLVNFLEIFRPGHLVYFSSGAVYDGLSGPVEPSVPVAPVLPYAVGKYAAERYIHFFSRSGGVGRFSILRFFGAYGPYEPPRKIFTRLVRAFALEGKREFTIRGDGKNLIDAMFVSDAVKAVQAVLDSEGADAVADLCVGEPLTLHELVERAGRAFGIEPVVRYEGKVPEYITFRPSPAAFRERFGFRPSVPLEEGLRRLAAFLKSEA